MSTLTTKLRGMKFQDLLSKMLTLLILSIGAIAILIPLYWLVRSSLMGRDMPEEFPPQLLPMDTKSIELDGRRYFIYAIPVEGELRELALQSKRGPIGIFFDPENPDLQYELEVQSGERVRYLNLHFENYPRAIASAPGRASFDKYLRNSLVFVIVNTTGTLLSSTLVAYGFARFRAKGSGVLFLLLLSTIMLPGAVTLIPTFVLFKTLGWYNTLLPLMVPAFFGNAWWVFWLRQYFMTLPLELDDAARIDGCGPLGVLWYIITPQALPALATVAVFQSLWAWNEFFLPLIYLKDMERWTVSIGLQIFQSRYGGGDRPALMAASVMVMMPTVLLFLFAQRLFIQGTVIRGIEK